MNKRKRKEEQIERLDDLTFELEKKEIELKKLQETLNDEKADLLDREETQKRKEEEFLATWHSASGNMMANTSDEIMSNIRDVMNEYSTGLYDVRRQVEIMTAACNNTVSRIIESGNRNGKELFREELGNALYASYVDKREFEDIANETVHEHALLNIGTPEELERLGSYGFRNNVFIRRVELPRGITEVLPSFFFGCARLLEVWIPDSVEKIGINAFYGCSSLKKIHLGKNSKLKEIGDYAFALNTRLESITLPNPVKTIGVGVLRGCESLSSIVWPKSTSSIQVGSHMLQNCRTLKEITLPETITEIPTSMFFGCTSLKSVSALKVDTVGPYAFSGSSQLRLVHLGKEVEINPLAFEGTDPSLEIIYKD